MFARVVRAQGSGKLTVDESLGGILPTVNLRKTDDEHSVSGSASERRSDEASEHQATARCET